MKFQYNKVMKNNIIIAVIHYRPGGEKKKNCPRNEEGAVKKT